MSGGTTMRILQEVDSRSRPLVERLHKLLEIGALLSAEQDLIRLLGLILRESRLLTSADAGAIFIREDELTFDPRATGKDPICRATPFLVIKVAQNDSIQFPFKEMKLPFDRKTVSGHAAVSGEIVNLVDAYHIPPGAPYTYSTSFDEISGYRCRSMLVIPMKNRSGEITGVIQLINKKRDPSTRLDSRGAVETGVIPFDATDEDLLTALASQAAICIERTKLYDDIERMFEGLVGSFTLALERRNRTTYGHCMRVARYAIAIAEAVNDAPPGTFDGLRFTPLQLRELRYAALLHDIGKIAVPEAILDKRNKLLDSEILAIEYRLQCAQAQGLPAAKTDGYAALVRRVNVPRGFTEADRGRLDEMRADRFLDASGQARPLLSDAEFENLAVARGNLTAPERRQVEQHVVDTWEILKRIPWPRDYRSVANIAACHHEKLDGSGYPWKLKGDEIPIGGQILAIVDIFEALTAKDRPYKPAMPVEQAMAIIQAEVDRGALNARLWKLFLDRKIYALFRGESGFVQVPAELQLPV